MRSDRAGSLSQSRIVAGERSHGCGMASGPVPRRHDRHASHGGWETRRVRVERRQDRLRAATVECDPARDGDIETRGVGAKTRKAPRIPRTGKCPELRPRPQTVARCGAEVEKQENANQVTHRAAHELRDGGARRCAFASTIVPQASTAARVEWSSGY